MTDVELIRAVCEQIRGDGNLVREEDCRVETLPDGRKVVTSLSVSPGSRLTVGPAPGAIGSGWVVDATHKVLKLEPGASA